MPCSAIWRSVSGGSSSSTGNSVQEPWASALKTYRRWWKSTGRKSDTLGHEGRSGHQWTGHIEPLEVPLFSFTRRDHRKRIASGLNTTTASIRACPSNSFAFATLPDQFALERLLQKQLIDPAHQRQVPTGPLRSRPVPFAPAYRGFPVSTPRGPPTLRNARSTAKTRIADRSRACCPRPVSETQAPASPGVPLSRKEPAAVPRPLFASGRSFTDGYSFKPFQQGEVPPRKVNKEFVVVAQRMRNWPSQRRLRERSPPRHDPKAQPSKPWKALMFSGASF